MHPISRNIILFLFSFAFIFLNAHLCFAQPDPDAWRIHLDGDKVAVSPLRMEGDVAVVDVLSFADALEIVYHRDELGRYVFRLPDARAIFVPDGAFARIAGQPVQLPVPVRKTDVRLFVPEREWVTLLNEHAPGTVVFHRTPRALTYHPPESDVVSLKTSSGSDTANVELLLVRPLTGRLELIDSTTISLSMPSANLRDLPAASQPPDDMVQAIRWDRINTRFLIDTRDPVRHARLHGPGDDNRLVLTLFFNGDDAPVANEINSELAEERRKWMIDKVVIDAGHGGKDPGAIGKRGTREKDMTLDTALMLRELMQKRLPDVEVVMTRDDDTFIPLRERTQIANRVEGKLFISIHFNAAGNRSAHGLETYFLAPARTERAMKIAMKENAVIRYEEQMDQYPDMDNEPFILLSMAQAQFGKESEDLAAMVQDGMHKQTGQSNRGVDQAGFYVLMGASMPAILVEGGFLSNAREENLVRTKEYRLKVAESICDAIEAFITKYEQDASFRN